MGKCPEAQFLVSDWGNIVESSIGCVNYMPKSGTKNLATALHVQRTVSRVGEMFRKSSKPFSCRLK